MKVQIDPNEGKENNGFQAMLFQALAKRLMRGGVGGRKSQKSTVTGCPHFQMQHTFLPHATYGERVPYVHSYASPVAHSEPCVHPSVFGGVGRSAAIPGTKAGHRRNLRKTGPSAFQSFKRVVDPSFRQQCESMVMNGHREVGPIARQCRNQSVMGSKRCKTHGGTPGTPKASSGVLVALVVEEMPILADGLG